MARRRNAWTAFAATGALATMLAASYASVPLYRVFCQVTGFGGTTQRVAAAPTAVGAREVTVTFDSNINTTSGALPWTFEPLQRQVRLRVGEQTLVHYRATNTGTETVTGVATFNVTPAKAGAYFDKMQCFCFSEQTLRPGEAADMPVVFFVDPAIANDRNLDDVTDIVLSYTFFRAQTTARRETRADVPALARETF